MAEKKRASNKKYPIEIIENDGTKRVFPSLLKANQFYGLRKDYLNYCFAERHKHLLSENGLNIKSIRKIVDKEELNNVM